MYQKESWRQRMGRRFQRFMSGRYGQRDKLNSLLLWCSIIAVVASVLVPVGLFSRILSVVAYLLMGYAMFRIFSRNTYKRYRENRRYLNFLTRIRDRKHRYSSCPRCKQSVRVPKGKGKIQITCPKCGKEFIRKS